MSGKLADQLRRLRQVQGVSLRKVEKATGISNAYISQLERGEASNPSPRKLHELASYYDVPYESLMRAAGYIEKTEGSSREKNPSALESKLMSLKLTPEEEEMLIRFVENVIRGGESKN